MHLELIFLFYFVASILYMTFNIDEYCGSAASSADSLAAIFIFTILLVLVLNPFYIFPIKFYKTVARGGILSKTLAVAKEVVRHTKELRDLI